MASKDLNRIKKKAPGILGSMAKTPANIAIWAESKLDLGCRSTDFLISGAGPDGVIRI